MFLKRISQAINKQDWFALSLEFFIVVLGIFFALQIEGWDQEQSERKLEKVYISRLMDETNANKNLITVHEKIFEDKISFILALTEIDVSYSASQDPQRFLYQLDYSSYVQIPRLRAETYKELESSGRLILIRNAELRKELAGLFNDYQSTRSVFLQPIGNYRRLLFETLPGSVYAEYRVGKGVYDVNDIVNSVTSFKNHPDFKSAANAEITYGADALFYLREFQERLNKILKLLESERT